LQRALQPLGDVIALDRAKNTITELCGDLADLPELKKSIFAINPDVIINAAAYTAVDGAEKNSEQADLINSKAPQLLAELMKKSGGWLVHYSTDYVFDGSGCAPWKEGDAIGPLNTYGATKLKGEQAIQDSGCNHLIFRTSWVFASKGDNFAKTMLRLATQREILGVIADQIGAPTGASLIADVTAHTLRTSRTQPNFSGLYHLAAAGQTSWHGYASFVIEQSRLLGQSLTVKEINEIPSSEYPTPAQRPLNSRLECDKLRASFGLELPHWKIGGKHMLLEIQGY
jgi:dTDP-4-dehydrorhamnose reductase